MPLKPRKILIIRNDKLGDFMLAYPAFMLAKASLANCEVHALVPEYTRNMAEVCPGIDRIMLDPGANASIRDQWQLLLQLRRERYDAVVSLYSTTHIGLLCWLARIPYRLAPATKLAQLFYNHTLKQKRSRSEKPEYMYNLDLLHCFLAHMNQASKSISPPYLQFEQSETHQLRQQFEATYHIPAGQKLIFIHPGSGGSANNLSLQQYSELIKNLHQKNKTFFVITAGPDELISAQQVADALQSTPHIIFSSNNGLLAFAKHIAFADLFISGSTGTLHIAGALDVPTVAFYTRRQSATALRWQTLNSEKHHLSFSPPDNSAAEDMSTIDIVLSAQKIKEFYLS